jgi:hypothetical protein
MSNDSSDKPAGRVTEVRLSSPAPQPVEVKHHGAPPPYARRERIHPRRILPRVREGKEREFHSTTRQIMLREAPRMPAAVRAATDDLVLVRNTGLTEPAQQQLASNVDEPSAAINGDVVMYTGNWYAARSIDGGQSFDFIDPFTSFPDPPNLGFCCDQVVNYIQSIDTFVWLLQYGPKSGAEADNIQRLAFATSDNVKAGRWRLFDLTTDSLGVAGQFLDFPDLAIGANSLYVTTNIFSPQGSSAGAAVVRIPIATISAGPVTAQPFVSPDLDSFRVAQNCGTRAFFAAHHDTSTLNVFTWDEGQTSPVSKLVAVARWIGGSGFRSVCPDGRTWLDRADPRMTGAALAGEELYFAWGVDANSNHRAQPFIQIARIDTGTLTLLENINVFDPNSATCYGALSTNADNEVGISYMLGGGSRFPTHVVGILTGTRKDAVAATGNRSPLPSSQTGNGEWGDYLTVRPVFPDRKLFAATGYTMNGSGDGSNRDATPRFVIFGRSSDAGAVPPPGSGSPGTGTTVPSPPVAPGPLPPTPHDDGEPITDVNTLGVVSAAVASQIKAACGLVVSPEGMTIAPRTEALPAKPLADKPGTERWPVKTGQDPDRAKVGKNVIDSVDLGAGIVESTVEELGSIPRPPGMEDAKKDPTQFTDARDGVAEVTIWRIEATIIALKHETDGDYHLVLQGDSGAEMVGEVPTPTNAFIGDSPWLSNIQDARQQVDDRLVKHLSPAAFALMNNRYLPRGAMMFPPRTTAAPGLSFVTPPEGSPTPQPLFSVAVTPTRARITGVGFFDRDHGQTGAAPNVIELHPVLKVEWL